MPDAGQRAWLETLDPAVRLEAEAEIAFYDNEDLWEFETVDVDREPGPELGMGLMVDFDADELRLMFDALGREADFASVMKAMVLKRARAGLPERSLTGTSAD